MRWLTAPRAPAWRGNGLSDSASGFRFRLGSGPLRAGASAQLDVTLERDGKPFTRLENAHDEPPLHLIFVRRDLAGYVHLHPRRLGKSVHDGGRARRRPGIWRAYADFEVDGEKIVLGQDVFVPGDSMPQRLPPPRQSPAVDGYGIRCGAAADLTFEITRGGRLGLGVAALPGAAGHLVAIREEDLAYLHVHPLESPRAGTIAFEAELEEPGRYALFLQFRHGGRVHTVPFTLVAT